MGPGPVIDPLFFGCILVWVGVVPNPSPFIRHLRQGIAVLLGILLLTQGMLNLLHLR